MPACVRVRTGPVIDGVEIEDDPRKLAAAGKFNKVPVLLGTSPCFARIAGHCFRGVGHQV